MNPDPMHRLYFEPLLPSARLLKFCQEGYAQIITISDENVAALHAEPLQSYLRQAGKACHLITVPAGESAKTRAIKAQVEDKMFALGCNRDTLMLALGGGAVTDLAGFIAATFNRGIDVIYLPSSLLAMVDASIGGKTGINTAYGKNLLGTFTDPLAVFLDVSLLETLPDNEYRTAFAEIIKHAVIIDSGYFEELVQHSPQLIRRNPVILNRIIKRSCEIKASVVAKDKTEQGLRKILNYGHSIGHALEKLSQYQMPHGQCVAIGMLAEARIAQKMGLLAASEIKRLAVLIQQFGIGIEIPFKPDMAELKQALKLDKKNVQGMPHFVLLNAIGQIHQVRPGSYSINPDEAIVDEVLQELVEKRMPVIPV